MRNMDTLGGDHVHVRLVDDPGPLSTERALVHQTRFKEQVIRAPNIHQHQSVEQPQGSDKCSLWDVPCSD